MNETTRTACSDCQTGFEGLSRREFVRTVGVAAAAATAAPLLVRPAHAAPTPNSPAETAVKHFYDTLSAEQKQAICLPFNHQKQSRISANWHVTDPLIADDFYTDDQRKLIHDILKGVTSEDGYERMIKQMDDDSAGIGHFSVAVFGEPGNGQFQWVLTGRHLTVRADGDTTEGAAFGGPIIYGHGEEDPARNMYHAQTRKANEVFQALDPKQREQALLEKAPRESDVALQGKTGTFPGLAVGELSSDQKTLVEDVVKVLLNPYRKEDVEEVVAFLKEGGGFEKLHMAFYKQGDLKNDQVWDIWRVEGPTFVWHFRGAPHVHTYVNIGRKA
ncbi:MAG TPA: DUF3500 domain-containing protein [Planctomycetaceae bacterium]|nr:DUF3500 domain-containing protein [Planctomycetaceae bacterium]